jgi:hypothetical protein
MYCMMCLLDEDPSKKVSQVWLKIEAAIIEKSNPIISCFQPIVQAEGGSY